MTTTATAPTGPTTEPAIEGLSRRLADALMTGDAGDLFTDDVFFDGHPPYWRFQLQGIEDFGSWLRGYVVPGSDVSIVRTIPTAAGFVTELTSEHHDERGVVTGRELILCGVRDGRIAELSVYCSGEWDAELRARHAAEAPMIRP